MTTAWSIAAITVLVMIDGAALAGQEPSPAGKPAPGNRAAASPAEYDGWKVYHSWCDRCHGQDATGSTFAPDLRQSVGANGMTEPAFAAVVRDGRVDKGMPGFSTTISDSQYNQLYAYVAARSTGALGPGRPKRQS